MKIQTVASHQAPDAPSKIRIPLPRSRASPTGCRRRTSSESPAPPVPPQQAAGARSRALGASLIKDAGRLALPAALTIGKQICRALEVAHEAGIVHRDIKPQNLLVDPTGFLKVTDSGIARLAGTDSGAGKALTVEGAVVGTPQYMAPEQLFGEPVDGRADLYATGAVLFECVTGRRVYEASSTMALVAHHLNEGEPPPDPASLHPEVPPAFSGVILRALARKPAERWQTAADLLHALEAV